MAAARFYRRAPPQQASPTELEDAGLDGDAQGFRRAPDHVLLAGVGGASDRPGKREPADLLHLMVVLRYVPSHGFHEVEGDPLPNPFSPPHEPVRDVTQRSLDLCHQAGFLLDLPERGLLRLLAHLHRALRQPPHQVALTGHPRRQRHLDSVALSLDHHAPRRVLEAGLHGAGRAPRLTRRASGTRWGPASPWWPWPGRSPGSSAPRGARRPGSTAPRPG